MRTTIRLNGKDIELLKLLAIYSYLDITFVLKNCYKENTAGTIRKRLKQLEVCGYIESRQFFVPNEITIPMNSYYIVYALSKMGIDLLDKWYSMEPNYQDLKTATTFYVHHQIILAHALNEVVKAINEKENTKVVEILNEYDSYDREAHVRPDSSLIVEFNGVLIIIFIEMERSSANDKNLKKKIMRYNLCKEDRLYKHITFSDIKDSRVLFISNDRSNPEQLLSKIIASKPTVDVLVASYDDIMKDASGRIYYGVDRKEHGLFAQLPKL